MEHNSVYHPADHIHVINQVKEKCKECNISLCIAFVHCEKAFDSVHPQEVLTSLQELVLDDVYIELLKDIYTNSSMTVLLHTQKQQDQHQEMSTTGRYHIAQAIYGSTRKRIPTIDLGNQRLKYRRRIS